MSASTGAPPTQAARARAFVARHRTQIGAGAAALVAVVLLVVALSSSGKDQAAPAPSESAVVVATRLVPRGSTLDGRVEAGSLRVRHVASDRVASGAVTSLAALHGKVAAADIRPGAQVTAADLSSDVDGLPSQLKGAHRAVTVPIDRAHGMVGDVSVGDRVDVYASFQLTGADGRPHPVLKTLARDVEVLRAPTAADSGGDDPKTAAQVTLDLGSNTAAQAAFTADYGKLWIVARPAVGAASPAPRSVTLSSLLGALAKGNG
ncbi:MAG TPA: Flp pilus assembly protein CpaB [Solirubrobacteraceae bacterium]|jgi:Flp pilus assembly protein CpaB|nr:Flp pilus assembly protein CpaB [Solirubrobacteraceae bacterium]